MVVEDIVEQVDRSGRIVLAAEHVVTVAGDVFSPGRVVVEDGRIAEVGPGREAVDHDYGRAAIMPGFVDSHTHLGCAFLRGRADDAGFLDWLTGDITPLVIHAVRHEEDRLRQAAHVAADELLHGGVTMLGDSFFHDAGREAMLATGLRGVFFREYFGSMSDDLDAYRDEMRGTIAADLMASELHRVSIGLAPHSPYTCPDDVLREIVEQAHTHDLPVTIHVDESEEEHRFRRDAAGPMFDLFATDEDRRKRYVYGHTPVATLDRLGLLGPRTLAVHLVQSTTDDIAILARSGASVVHCPSSNLKLAVGVAPLAEWWEADINVALGTDSPASTGKLDMFEEMRLAVLLQRGRRRRVDGPSAHDVLAMATRNGAIALGYGGDTGTLEIGKAADLAVVRLDQSRHHGVPDPVSAIVYGSTPDDVVAVWIAGRPRFDQTSVARNETT